MTYIIRDCTVNPPRIIIEIVEEDKRPFDPKPQIKIPSYHCSNHFGYWVIAAMLSIFTVGALQLFLG